MNETAKQKFDPRIFYRKVHPECFSDSFEKYEVVLTREQFDFKLSQLSTLKEHSDFEKFVIALVVRKITPNVIPQSGPDGGGDGKIDAETHTVSSDVSEKWYSVEDGGASGDEKWAIAISCKEKYKKKIEDDVKKIVDTKRGYTKILCFTSQVVKGDARVSLAQELSSRYGIKIEIFDRTWIAQVVFDQDCYDVAVDKLQFSNEYRRKITVVGPNDLKRRARFAEIENSILRRVERIDTSYVDTLQESYELARATGKPKDEVLGLFQRALEACDKYGTVQKKFNILYDRAWTSVFWFGDFEQAFDDYLIVKDLAFKEIAVARIEKLSNLLSVLHSAARYGFFDADKIRIEMDEFEELTHSIENDSAHRSAYLFAKLFAVRRQLMEHLDDESLQRENVSKLRALIKEASSHIEISIKSQYKSLEILSGLYKGCDSLDDLVDELASMVSKADGEIAQADERLKRAHVSIEKGRISQAIAHLGFCLRAYDREECQDKLIQSSGLMGIALWELKLPYSAQAYLSKAACFMHQQFRRSGDIPHQLHTVLRELCEIELFLGRLVMYMNWHRLACMVFNDAQFRPEDEFNNKRIYTEDAAWLCRFSVANLKDPILGKLPDVLDRDGLCMSADYLRYVLGYTDGLSEVEKDLFEGADFKGQPVFEQFLDDLNVSQKGSAYARTTVNNLTVRVDYENSIENQNVAEILLASVEALFATTERGEIAALNPEVRIRIERSEGAVALEPVEDGASYVLRLNFKKSSNADLWTCLVNLIAHLFVRNILTKGTPKDYIDLAQNKERAMDRVSVVQQLWMAKELILGRNYPFVIESWIQDSDRVYACRVERENTTSVKCWNRAQHNMTTFVTTQNRSLWVEAGWRGTLFSFDPRIPPFIGLVFEDMTAGAKIIEEWRRKKAKGEPAVRIVILRGINRNHPAWYRVAVLPDVDLKRGGGQDASLVMIMCQRNTMMPSSSENLDSFEEEYNLRGGCWVAAVDSKTTSVIDPKTVFANSMPISNLRIVYVHELKENDEALMALMKDDDPIVPVGKSLSDSVVKTLETLRREND